MDDIRLHIAAGAIKRAAHIPMGLEDLVYSISFGAFTVPELVGNPEPTYYFHPKRRTSWNSVGLKNQSLAHFCEHELKPITMRLGPTACATVINLAPTKGGDTGILCDTLQRYAGYVSAAEINGACPNHYHSDGTHSGVLAYDPKAVEEQLAETTGFRGEKWYKIAPNTPDDTLQAIIELCERYGVTGIVSGNTLSDSSEVDGIQRLSKETGGKAGAELLDMAVDQYARLKVLNDLRAAPRKLIACGGVMDPYGIKRYREVGATDVALGTYFHEYGAGGIRDLLVAC